MGVDQLARRLSHDPLNHESICEVSLLLNRAISETRTISHLLHPPLLDEIGLESALAVYADGFAKRSGITVAVKVSSDLGRLDSDVETALFRVVQECLLNVHRHSNSSTASVSLDCDSGEIRLQVRDEGVGIATAQSPEGASLGVGLLGIQERIRQLAGKLEVVSGKGKGTLVVATIPHRRKNNPDSPGPVALDASSAALGLP
jgi:two-component system, NarL family, sensor kinase